MKDKVKDPNHNVAVILPHHAYEALKMTCIDRGDTLSGFGRRAIYTEMTRLGVLSPKRKAALGV
jgi:hypothetical protein